MNTVKDILNKDLILREELAIERTHMANQTTFLAFLRTSLYFPVAGVSMHEVLDINYGLYLQWGGVSVGIFILTYGIIHNRSAKRRIDESRKHIGSYVMKHGDL